MFKVKYNNEKAVTCYNGEIKALEILRNYVQNSYKISVYRDTIIVATKDKKIVAIAGMEGLIDILEPFDIVYVFKKDEITFDYNNKELMENFINNNDINIIDPENIENGNIKINRTNDSIINIPTPVQETSETPAVETSLQTESVPTINTVNVAPITQVTSVETKKKSKAPLIIIIILLLVGLGVAAYFLIPKITNGNTNDSSNSKKTSSNTKKEDKLKSNEVYYYDWVEDKNKIVTVPKEQKVVLIFSKTSISQVDELYITKQDKYFSLIGIYNNDFDKDKYKDFDYIYVDSVVKNGYLEIPDEVEGNKVVVIGKEGAGVKTRTIFGFDVLDEKNILEIPLVTEIKIPESVELINPAVFEYSLLTKVDIPDNVKIIGSSAFSYSPNLAEVILPKKLNYIRGYAFKGCENLESVKTRGAKKDYDIVLDATELKEIAYSSFHDCKKLKSLAIINNTDDNLNITSSSKVNDPKFNSLEEIYIEGYVDLQYRLSSDIPLKKLMLEDIEKNHIMIDGDKKFILPLSIPENCEVEYFKLEK